MVVGAGNAALCAAVSATQYGASVLVLEKSPKAFQGGNCPYTGAGFRFTHDGIDDLKSLLLESATTGNIAMSPYTAEDFWKHLEQATYGDSDERLVNVLIAQSRETVDWMHSIGVQWE